MTWEETIQHIRQNPAFKQLVIDAYFDADLPKNVERYQATPEYTATLQLFQQYAPNAQTLLDIGCGNGMSSISFAQNGYHVTALEPDPSQTIGAGAIRQLKSHYQLTNIDIMEGFAEDIRLQSESFDIVYIRQAMHHAHDLNQFIAQAARVLKKGGLLLTVRDHVIYDEADKLRFLEAHPLHRYYGGENAFTEAEYRRAFELAGLRVDKILKYFDNVINYYPNDSTIIEKSRPHQKYLRNWQQSIYMKIPYLRRWLNRKVTEQYGIVLDETVVAGRLYTFVGIKQ